MSNWLTAALMPLFLSMALVTTDVQAGPCKREQVKDNKGKCVNVPTALTRAPEVDTQPAPVLEVIKKEEKTPPPVLPKTGITVTRGIDEQSFSSAQYVHVPGFWSEGCYSHFWVKGITTFVPEGKTSSSSLSITYHSAAPK